MPIAPPETMLCVKRLSLGLAAGLEYSPVPSAVDLQHEPGTADRLLPLKYRRWLLPCGIPRARRRPAWLHSALSGLPESLFPLSASGWLSPGGLWKLGFPGWLITLTVTVDIWQWIWLAPLTPGSRPGR